MAMANDHAVPKSGPGHATWLTLGFKTELQRSKKQTASALTP